MSYRTAVEIVLAAALGVFVLLWLRAVTDVQGVGETRVATDSPLVRAISKEQLDCVPVKVYATPAAKRLGVEAQRVVSASVVKEDVRPHTIITTLDPDTGDVAAYDRREPHPWIAVSTRGQVGLGYGYVNGMRGVRFEARQALVDIKGVRIEAVGSYDRPLDARESGTSFIGLSASLRW